jgi:DNA-binding transcriptional LysR family regulator
MHVTLRQLRIFEAVASHHSISRAAAELHITQPAVSMQMKQLEEQIGVPLVEQVGKRMFLTEAGRELRGHTREVVLALLADNSTDLAITGRPPDSMDVVAQHFMDNPLVVIAAPSHALATDKPISLQRLAEETLVVREPGSGTRAAMEKHFAAHGVVCRAGCELGTNEALKQAVRAGLGIGVVSVQTIELELQTGCLVVLPVEHFPIVRRWFVLHRTHKRLSAAALTFRERLLALDPAQPAAPAPAPAERAGGRRAKRA